MSITLMNYRLQSGVKTVLVDDSGTKWLQVLMMKGTGLVIQKVPLSEQQFMTPPIQNGRLKSMNTVLREFRSYGRKTGMTKAVKSFLKKAKTAA